jgi:hypothetical protein
MIRCAFCNKVSPDDALQCDCGTHFKDTQQSHPMNIYKSQGSIMDAGFFPLVLFLIKLFFAAIPAIFILTAIYYAVLFFLA